MADLSLILHDIRSVHNVASMFRTADGAGVKKIYLTGHTPGPIDRFGRSTSGFAKVSLGAENTVPWEKRDIHELLTELKKDAVHIAMLEQSDRATPLEKANVHFPAVLVVGNEVDGISETILDQADTVLEIPMRGTKESLNVSVAAGVALYFLTKDH